MKKHARQLSIILFVIISIMCMSVTPVFGASTRKCYSISSGNTTVYKDTALKVKYGAIYATDEITVLEVTSRYCKVNYPTTKGRTKTGYIYTGAILRGTTGSSYRSRAKITTYKRPGGSSYGYISKGDTVKVLGTYGNYTQVKYPVSGGYKYAFIATSNYNQYIKPSNSSQSSQQSSQKSGQFQYPMSGYWTTQRFGAYSSTMAKKGRAYHSGIDIKSNNTRVNAAANGIIKYRGYTSGNGNHVIIQHNLNGTTVYTLYSHLANFNGCPAVGNRVSKGAKIGVMGNTGNSTGAHLHFGIFTGYSRDPYGYTNVNNSNKASYRGLTFYNPNYVVSYNRLP